MNHIDLFSGIAGFSLAANYVWKEDHNIICFVEKDPFCRKVLNKHWPSVPIVEDIKNIEEITKYAENVPAIDLLTGGFPCQSFSVAGKQRGKEDDRYLWPDMFEIIRKTMPTWVIGENVPGIINMALDTVLADLESEGYSCQTFIIPACSVNAPHRRDRCWIVGHSKELHEYDSNNKREESRTQISKFRNPSSTKAVPNSRLQRQTKHEEQTAGLEQCRESGSVADTKGRESGEPKARNGGKDTGRGSEKGTTNRPTKQRLGLCHDGLSEGVVGSWGTGEWEEGIPRVTKGEKNRVNKLKALGNAIVPQVAVELMQFIKVIHENAKNNA